LLNSTDSKEGRCDATVAAEENVVDAPSNDGLNEGVIDGFNHFGGSHIINVYIYITISVINNY
jgi:hypothetical protein